MSGFRKKCLRLLLVCTLALLGLHAELYAQQVTVRGRVVDAKEQPVAGAVVAVQGTSERATTDAKGEFSIAVPNATATLTVTGAGFAPGTVTLNGQSNILVHLTTTSVQLEGLVVVGYGTQKRSDVTGSVASVSSERIAEQPTANFAQAIQGAVAGVNVTTSGGGAEPTLNVMIRGRNSITANTDPLVVIDGIPYNGSISEINQNDIQSIDVLKDASAAAIYGARGSNGVLLLTTRKGTGKPRISYDGYAGAQQVAHLPGLMTGPQFAAFKCQRQMAVTAKAAVDPCGESQIATYLTPSELAVYQAGTWTDWLGEATRTGLQQQHNLSVSGSAGDTRYYLGGSLLDIQGVAQNDEFQRYSLRLNLDQKLHQWITLGTSTQLGLTNRGGIAADLENAFFQNPLTSAYNADGSLTVYPWADDPFFGNPLQGLLVPAEDDSHRVFTSNYAQLDFPFLKGLSYRVNAGLDYANRDQGRYYGRDTRSGLVANGLAITSQSNRSDWTVENIARYNRAFGKHSVDLTTLYSIQQSSLESTGLRGEGFPNDVLTYHQPNVALLLTPSSSVTQWDLLSQMARLNYGYASRYLLTLTARRDGYSGFGANHKYGVFPSMAVGWNVSREGFWPFADRFNTLKLRASYGQNGNQAVSPYRTLAALRELPYIDDALTYAGYVPATLGNPDLRWETTTQLNLGADFGFLNDRVTGSLDFYNSRTHDLLLRRAISPVHGIDNVTENMGRTKNHGMELHLSTINVERDGFGWNSDFNISANRNQIVDLYGNGQSDIVNRWFIGQPISVNYGYRFGGIFQTGDDIAHSAQPTAKPGDVKIVDVNGDGVITPDDRVILGNLEPSYTAGLNNTLRYRGLSFSFMLTTVQGLNRPNPLLDQGNVWADVRRNMPMLNWWSPSNPTNEFPANREGSNPLSVDFFQNASYVRLKDVTLSYTLPGALTGRLGVQSLRLYVNGRNLWTHSDWTGLDPELDNSHQRGVPLERVLVAGINTSF
ncbi:MAG: TonB-dependent receptor [Gemmatimonadetes bacterium]|nr:TonB-dependent receptor [Gemmatimonadota bacterium]